jgi:hypothetical protein
MQNSIQFCRNRINETSLMRLYCIPSDADWEAGLCRSLIPKKPYFYLGESPTCFRQAIIIKWLDQKVVRGDYAR